MEPFLILTDGTRRFPITKSLAFSVERKLNKTEYGKPWSIIGDVLYKVGVGLQPTPKNIVLTVSSFQYDYVKEIYDKLIIIKSVENYYD